MQTYVGSKFILLGPPLRLIAVIYTKRNLSSVNTLFQQIVVMSAMVILFFVLVASMGVIGIVVITRMISQSMAVDKSHPVENGIEMRELSTDNADYAEVPGRVLLPQSC